MEQNMRDGRKAADKGFTLVEVMVAAGLGMFVIAILISASVTYQKLFKTQNLTNEMQQNVRAAIEMISRDLRTCGYGLQVSSGTLADWIDWIPGFDSNPKIQVNASGISDIMHVAAAFGQPIGYLAADANQGDTGITLTQGASKLNLLDKKVIFIGGLQTARATFISGNVLNISTHPTQTAGLEFNIQKGAPVEAVSVVTYRWVDNPSQQPFQPHLQRIDSTAIYVADWQKFAAGYIEEFKVSVTGKVVDVSITGRTAEPDYTYTHPVKGDHYRRFTAATRVIKKN